jgi:type II secretory pathway pseudopilin PulG
MPRRPREAGYTLLEFLVAFTILTACLAAFLSALAVALRGDQQATFLTIASVLAKTKLAGAGADFPLRAGETSNVFPNGFAWRAVVRNHAALEVGQDELIAVFWVEVTVSDPRSNNSRSFSLSSLEFARGERP